MRNNWNGCLLRHGNSGKGKYRTLDSFEGKTCAVLCAVLCLYQGQSHASVATLCSLGNGACPWPSLPWQLPAGYNNSLESETIQAHYCSNRLCLIVPVSPLWLGCLMTRAPGSILLFRFFPLL